MALVDRYGPWTAIVGASEGAGRACAADVTVEYGAEDFPGNGLGAIAWICTQHRAAVTDRHQITNTLIDLDGDRAGSEAYVISALRMEIEGRIMEFATCGCYLDRWSCRDGRWAIDRRGRDRGDPSYEILRQN